MTLSQLTKLLKKGLLFLRFQLFMTLVSWPFLIQAGILLSKATVLGNALFAPFFILFLGLSTCIALCEFLHIPSVIFTIPLEYLTTALMALLKLGERSWLFALPSSSPFLYFLVAAGLVGGLQSRFFIKPLNFTLWILLLMAVFVVATRSTIPREEHTTSLPCLKKELMLISCRTYALLFNPGCLHNHQGVVPLLVKRGISCLTSYCCAQPSSTNFLTTAALLEAVPVTFLYMPHWSGKLTNRGWSAWGKLLVTVVKTGTRLILLKPGETIKLQEGSWQLCTSQKIVTKNGCRYPQLSLLKA